MNLKDIIKKKNNSTGFSLAESLMVVLIMLLVSTVIATGIPAAANVYNKAIDSANAQVLLSTTVNSLRNELSTASGIKIAADKKSVTYYSSKTGARTRLYLGSGSDDGVIMVQDYVRYDDATKAQAPNVGENDIEARRLVSEEAVTKNLKVSFSSIDLVDDDIVKFGNIMVKKKDIPLAEIGDLNIRMLSPDLNIPEL